MLELFTPPTGTTGISFGNTADQLLITAGPIISAGNALMASAPALIAANASVGVATPGADTKSSCLVALMTSVSIFGDTIKRPPAAATDPNNQTGSLVGGNGGDAGGNWYFDSRNGGTYRTTGLKLLATGVMDGDVAGLAASAVPVPAAVWLFGSALLGLVGIGRKRQV